MQIVERAPIGVARLGRGGLHLIAADGTVLGPFGASAAYDLPIVDGLPPSGGRAYTGTGAIGVPAKVDPDRADLAARVVTALAGEPELLKLVSQMDVSDLEDAVVLLGDDPARVHLGHEDFARRVRAYRDLGRYAEAVRLARQGLQRFPRESVWPLLLSLALSRDGKSSEAFAPPNAKLLDIA